MEFSPRWLPTLVVFATLATLVYAEIAKQWLLVAIVLALLLIEVFMSGPVELDGGWFRVAGRLGRSPAVPPYPPTDDDPGPPAPESSQKTSQVARRKPPV